MSPTISIGIPTYEMKGSGHLYFGHLLETIRDQKFTNFEVCVSDHSKDDKILDLCGEYANYFTVKYFKNEENRGNCSSNINSVVEMCEGRITKLIFMDDMFIDPYAFTKINHAYETKHCNWCFNGFAHTSNGMSHERMKVPQWTDMMLEGRNLLGNPSGVSFLTDKFEGFDEKLDLLLDTDFYHRMRYNHGMPYILEDILTSNREHGDRMSSGAVCTYDARIEHPEGGWLVNKKELEYVLEKNKDTREYPDET